MDESCMSSCRSMIKNGSVTLALLSSVMSAAVTYAGTCKPCLKSHPGVDANLLPAPKKPVQISANAGVLRHATGSGNPDGSRQSMVPAGGRQATTLAGGTQATTLTGAAQSTMLTGGTQATTLTGGTQSAMLQVGTKSTLIKSGVEKVEQLNILLLMDSSHSMDEALDGTTAEKMEKKITVAKRVLEETLLSVPKDISLGLRVFGQSFRNDPFNDCRQSVLTVPIGTRNRAAIIDSVEQLRPYGLTPLAYTLMNAERDFHGLPGIHHVVLISDGAETCGGDPCTYIKRLTSIGIKMKVDIIGFGLKNDRSSKAQLDCIARSSGGTYYDAHTAGQLRDSLKKSIARAVADATVSGRVITKMKEPVLDPARIPAAFR